MTVWPKGYFQDAESQWWFSSGTQTRARARECRCKTCGATFAVVPKGKGRHCSQRCRSADFGGTSPIRPDLFEHWTAGESWLAGVIWADGCLLEEFRRYRQRRYVVLNTSDIEIADQAAAIVGAQVRTYPPGKRSILPSHRVQIGLAPVVERLVDLGLAPRKSKTCEWPSIPGHLDSFVRGYFDGDGSVGIYTIKDKASGTPYDRLKVNFVGSGAFLDGLQDHLIQAIGARRQKLVSHSNVYYLWYSYQTALDLAAYMYADGGPHLPRKAKVFQRARALPRPPLSRIRFPQSWPEVLMAA